MSNEAKQPPFKKGDMACLILRVTEFQPSLSTEEDDSRVIFDCTDIEGISTEYSFRHDVIFAATRHLRPAPREDEYLVTAAELHEICELYAAACVPSEVGSLEPMATRKYQRWLQQHSEYSHGDCLATELNLKKDNLPCQQESSETTF